MINNRQNGRRRGRGGGAPRPNGSGSTPDRGNRLDSRARGNAAQLHEKYKTLARDAQMQGDRVNTEYYLQFADHYFRVLSESRARFEEQQQRPRRDDYQAQGEYQPQGYEQGQGYDQDDYEDEGELNGNAGGNGEMRGGEQQQERYERQDRPQRHQRNEQGDRDQRGGEQFAQAQPDRAEAPRRARGNRDSEERRDSRDNGNGNEDQRPPRFEEQVADARQDEPDRAERPRRGRRSQSAPAVETVEVDRLPAFVTDAPLLAGVVEDEPAAEKKAVRRRRPRSDAVSADV